MVCSPAISRAAESSFYQCFLSIVSSNDLDRPVAVWSPMLVDTNNTAPRLTTSTNSLRVMRERGEASGIHLGMSMSEVVSKWGKPSHFWAKCGGGPRFQYAD